MNYNKKTTGKIYGINSLFISSFLGGPLATAILLRRNYISIGKAEKALPTLLTGILLVVGSVFLVIFNDSLVHFALTDLSLYFCVTAVLLIWVKTYQINLKKTSRAVGKKYYSIWRSVSISVFCMLFTIVPFLNFDINTITKEQYVNIIKTFDKNDKKAIELFKILETGDYEKSSRFINQVGLKLWYENIELISSLNNSNDLKQEFLERNEKLIKYCQYRIELYKLIDKAITESTNEYDDKLASISVDISNLVSELYP
jgi:hypothetical protein